MPVRTLRLRHACAAVTLMAAGAHLALAGPPLTIDDPGILDPGSFEVIVAAAIDSRDSGDSVLFPILDVSYGLSQNIQLAAVATRIAYDPDDGSSKSDFGPGAVSVKWRFLERDAMQMSVAPFLETQLRDGAVDRGVTEDLDAWVLPVQFQYEWPNLRLNAEVRYAAVHDEGDEWGYGVALAYPLAERLEALVEVHGGADYRLDDASWLYRVGIDLALTERWHILAAAGSSFDEPGDDDLDVQGYLGLQWFP
jgi:outer membrane receptor protein involved in Fe transport